MMEQHKLGYNKHMNTANTLESTGRIDAGAYTVTFSAIADNCWVTLYNAELDDCWTREYGTIGETLETITLLLTSNTMREEFAK